METRSKFGLIQSTDGEFNNHAVLVPDYSRPPKNERKKLHRRHRHHQKQALRTIRNFQDSLSLEA